MLIAAALIANHLTGRVFNYHDPIGEAKRIYNNLKPQSQNKPITTQQSQSKTATTANNTSVPANSHMPQADNTRCVDVSLGELKYKRHGDIYTWTDSEGIPHFSDKKPNFAVATYKSDYSEPLDYFDLTLNTPNLPPSFKQELQIKLNTVFKVYGQIIGVNALKKVKLNLTVLANKRAYETAINQYGGNPKNTAGMYFHATNSAFISYSNPQNTMRTAVHEAVHAINKAVLGYTPRWLNEGFAEYFELTENHMQTGTVEPNKTWIRNSKLAKSVYTINWLIGLENTWQKGNNSKLYASSWAAIYFLMDSPAGRNLLKKIMLAEQASPCNTLSEKQIKSMLFEQFPNLKNEYTKWLNTPFRPHNF